MNKTLKSPHSKLPFTESNTVEQMILDAVARRGGAEVSP